MILGIVMELYDECDGGIPPTDRCFTRRSGLRPGVYRTTALGTAFHGLPLLAERAAGEGDFSFFF